MPLLHPPGSSLINSQRLPSMLLLQLPGKGPLQTEDTSNAAVATAWE